MVMRRNFLIPQGKAKRATPAAIAEFEARRAELGKDPGRYYWPQLQARRPNWTDLMVQITRKAGVDGKLFGSVTNADIEEALKAQGFDH